MFVTNNKMENAYDLPPIPANTYPLTVRYMVVLPANCQAGSCYRRIAGTRIKSGSFITELRKRRDRIGRNTVCRSSCGTRICRPGVVLRLQHSAAQGLASAFLLILCPSNAYQQSYLRTKVTAKE